MRREPIGSRGGHALSAPEICRGCWTKCEKTAGRGAGHGRGTKQAQAQAWLIHALQLITRERVIGVVVVDLTVAVAVNVVVRGQ